jgi:CTP:molybdopterin cytidylyltransferase MocA
LVLSNLHWRHCQIINDPVELIDIDTESDFEKATKIIDSGCYGFGVPIC